MDLLAFPALLVASLTLQAPAAAPLPGGEAPKDDRQVSLGVGTQKVLDVEDVSALAVGAPQVIDVKPLGTSQVLVVGLSPGRSGLLVFRRGGGYVEYQVRVRRKDPGTEIEDSCDLCRVLLTGSPKLVFRTGLDLFFVDGLFDTPHDIERLLALYPQVRILARLDPAAVRRQVTEVNDALTRAGLRDVRAVLHGDTLLVEGTVHDEGERRKAQAIADDLFGPWAKAAKALEAHQRDLRPAPR